jgi:hypothetical protein
MRKDVANELLCCTNPVPMRLRLPLLANEAPQRFRYSRASSKAYLAGSPERLTTPIDWVRRRAILT